MHSRHLYEVSSTRISRGCEPTATPGAVTWPRSPLGKFSLHIRRGRDRRKYRAAAKQLTGKSGGAERGDPREAEGRVGSGRGTLWARRLSQWGNPKI